MYRFQQPPGTDLGKTLEALFAGFVGRRAAEALEAAGAGLLLCGRNVGSHENQPHDPLVPAVAHGGRRQRLAGVG